jgi:hypothetical protein
VCISRYVDSVITDVEAALKQPECKKEGSKEHAHLNFHAGKLMVEILVIPLNLDDPPPDNKRTLYS